MASVNKDMSIIDVLRVDDGTAEVFLNYGMTCLTCPFATAESLEAAAAGHGVNADELVQKLNEYLAKKG